MVETKEELRKKIFREMCDCAENISSYYFSGWSLTNMAFFDE
jgi:hypothetical protein